MKKLLGFFCGALVACGGSGTGTPGTSAPSGTSLTLTFTGPDIDTLTYEFSGSNAPPVQVLGGLTLNKLISDPANWVKAKENSVATCSQASLFTEITAAGTYDNTKFTFTTGIDPEGNVKGRALRSDGQEGTITVTTFTETRIEGSFETDLEQTNSSAEPAPIYRVKGVFGADRK